MKRPVGHADADHNEFGSSAPASFASSSIFPLTDFKLIIDTDVVRTSIAHSANKANAGVLFYPLQPNLIGRLPLTEEQQVMDDGFVASDNE